MGSLGEMGYESVQPPGIDVGHNMHMCKEIRRQKNKVQLSGLLCTAAPDAHQHPTPTRPDPHPLPRAGDSSACPRCGSSGEQNPAERQRLHGDATPAASGFWAAARMGPSARGLSSPPPSSSSSSSSSSCSTNGRPEHHDAAQPTDNAPGAPGDATIAPTRRRHYS
ncbi:hypothetical protein EYF80_021009 [Liparis tanakae]|uniref:Uncharacterized protein n=1 Tax=Liparis tanakae TaxID=230148 RepID=A0A4Z2HTE3_9TELE|nr:hypothetical protein EYF80_021009 [Liparis tanakae]